MAHAANLRELTGKLVGSVGTDDKNITEEAFKRLKDTTHSRVNPFEIEAQLKGLVEKFEVVSREDLSTSLQSCLDQLSLQAGWTPEILALLLELSDRPAEKVFHDTRADDVPREAAELTWNDILAQDPLNETDVWDDVDRGYHSSGDDRTEIGDVDSEKMTSTRATSVADDDASAIARTFIIQPDFAALSRLEEVNTTQKSANPDDHTYCSDLDLVREALDSLLGRPSTQALAESASSLQTKNRRLSSASATAVDDLMSQCGNIAISIQSLRTWLVKDVSVPFIQAMQSAVGAEVQRFDKNLTRIATRFLQASDPIVVSVLDVKAEVDATAYRLLALARPITKRWHETESRPFLVLQDMYEATCNAQLSSDDAAFDVLADVFLTGLQAFLIPVRLWMTAGTVTDDGAFFIAISDRGCELSTLWQNQFAVRRLHDGTPFAPMFLKPFLPEIFAVGKSRSLLDRLNTCCNLDESQLPTSGLITTGEIRDRLATEPLLPFQELFHRSVQAWITSTGLGSVERLNLEISQDAELWRVVQAIRAVFFGSDGIQFSELVGSLFDSTASILDDTFMLTRIAQATLGSIPTVDASRIVLDIRPDKALSSRLSSIARLELRYDLPWLLQNVVQREKLTLQPRILVVLLQCQYAREKLNRFILRTHDRVPMSTRKLLIKARHRLLWFANTWFSHVASTASQRHTELLDLLRSARGIDSMVKAWAAYEQRLEFTLLLSSKCGPLHTAVIAVLEMCTKLVPACELVTPKDGSQPPEDKKAGEVEILDDFERAVSFIQAGVRSVSRASGEPALEALSLALNWRDEA